LRQDLFHLRGNDAHVKTIENYFELPRLSESLTVKDLIGYGIDFTKTDKDGYHALQPVCEALNVAFVKDLIAAGADVNATDPDGITPLIATIEHCHFNPQAAAEIIELLLAAGADIEGRGDWDKTPFLKSCTRGQSAITQLLIDKGCDIHATAAELGGPMDAIEFADLPHNSPEFRQFISSLYETSSYRKR